VRPLVRLEAKAPGSWYVNVLATFPEFRRHGIGRELLAIAENKGRETAAPALSVIRLYRRASYALAAKERAIPFPGSPHEGDWVLMVKSLERSA
jgi:ribosomal protein S18 acetylase RimI-like enzyme